MQQSQVYQPTKEQEMQILKYESKVIEQETLKQELEERKKIEELKNKRSNNYDERKSSYNLSICKFSFSSK